MRSDSASRLAIRKHAHGSGGLTINYHPQSSQYVRVIAWLKRCASKRIYGRARRSYEEREELLRGVRKGASSIVYGVTHGPELEDMHPSPHTATEFLKAVSIFFRLSWCCWWW